MTLEFSNGTKSLFCFASSNRENIKLGAAAGRWAVARVSTAAMNCRRTKARRHLIPGALGLFYCNATHSFTTPFIVQSSADPFGVERAIWPGEWVLPFSFFPLGSPHKQISGYSAARRWSFVGKRWPRRGGVAAAMNLTGATAFTPIQISELDWRLILSDLADPMPADGGRVHAPVQGRALYP